MSGPFRLRLTANTCRGLRRCNNASHCEAEKPAVQPQEELRARKHERNGVAELVLLAHYSRQNVPVNLDTIPHQSRLSGSRDRKGLWILLVYPRCVTTSPAVVPVLLPLQTERLCNGGAREERTKSDDSARVSGRG